MKKLLLILLLPSILLAADQKVTELTRMANPLAKDLLYIVDDPCGSPLGQKIEWPDIFNGWIGSASITTLGTIGTGTWNADAIDTSDYTNLTAGTHVSLTDDTFDVLIGDVANGDDVNVPTCDNVYDWVIGLAYQTVEGINTFAELDGVVADKSLVNMADGAVWLGVHDFGGATSLELPNNNDPDVDAAGEISWDANDYSLRGFDDTNQCVIGQIRKTITIPISNPDELADTDAQPVWENHTGFTFVIEHIYARCNDQAGDDGDFTLKEVTDLTDWTALTTIEAITMSTDGTSVDYAIIGANDIDHATIENNHGIIYDASVDDLDWVIIVLEGYLNANKD